MKNTIFEIDGESFNFFKFRQDKWFYANGLIFKCTDDQDLGQLIVRCGAWKISRLTSLSVDKFQDYLYHNMIHKS